MGDGSSSMSVKLPDHAAQTNYDCVLGQDRLGLFEQNVTACSLHCESVLCSNRGS